VDTKIHAPPALSGTYDLRRMETAQLGTAQTAQIGMVRIGAGTRSPPDGFRTSAQHEVAYIVEGRVRVDTSDESRVVDAGSVVVSSPAELHATTALVDTTIFFVLIDPDTR
jgi:quercetin dioxygenase-like cupin family protein